MNKSFKIFGIIAIIVIIITVIFTIGRKAVNALKIKISSVTMTFPNNFKSASDFVLNDFVSKAIITLSNYSTFKYKISQISIDILTSKGNIIASQNNPITNTTVLNPNANTDLEILFKLNYTNVLNLVRDNGLLKNTSNILNVLQNIITRKSFGTDVVLKGFVIAEGLKYNINEIVKI